MLEALNYIGGRWVPAGTGATGTSLNPATGQPLGTFAASAEADVQAAVASAAAAYPKWRKTPAPARAEHLHRHASDVTSAAGHEDRHNAPYRLKSPYFTMHQIAWKPSFQPIFFPSE